jgi:ferredoxin
MEKCQVTIERRGESHTYTVRKGLGFQALHTREKTSLEFDCREADCGICIFKVLKGQENLSPKTFQEKDFLAAMHADPNERLACQCRIMGDVTIQLDF